MMSLDIRQRLVCLYPHLTKELLDPNLGLPIGEFHAALLLSAAAHHYRTWEDDPPPRVLRTENRDPLDSHLAVS